MKCLLNAVIRTGHSKNQYENAMTQYWILNIGPGKPTFIQSVRIFLKHIPHILNLSYPLSKSFSFRQKSPRPLFQISKCLPQLVDLFSVIFSVRFALFRYELYDLIEVFEVFVRSVLGEGLVCQGQGALRFVQTETMADICRQDFNFESLKWKNWNYLSFFKIYPTDLLFCTFYWIETKTCKSYLCNTLMY